MQGVGKSCLVLRYVRNQFDPSSKITVSSSGSVHVEGTAVSAGCPELAMTEHPCMQYG